MYTFSHMRIANRFRSLPRAYRSILLPALIACCLALLPIVSASAQAKTTNQLLIYAIDVEGGQATLLVDTATHASLLVDTGWPGENGRDAGRIQQAMRDAGITRIDHVLITHFHTDHVGGVPELVKRVPVGEFIDHGLNREDSDITRHDYAAYLKAIEGKPRRIVHPGDTINIPGLEAIVLTADGEHIAAVPGVKPMPNPYCAAEPKWDLDTTENPRSTGVLIRFGKFRFLDLGDLTKKKELELACPDNILGTVDLFLVTHHGADLSNPKPLVWALHPRVAIFDNGPRKGASPAAWQIVHDSPGIEDVWQVHYAAESDHAHNVSDGRIANVKENCEGKSLKVTAEMTGSFTVTNTRTGVEKTYAKK